MASRPTVNEVGDALTLDFHQEAIYFTAERWREVGGDLKCMLTVRASAPDLPEHLHESRVNLCSLTDRERLIRGLQRRAKDSEKNPVRDWDGMIEHLVREALAWYRQGAPIVELEPARSAASRLLVEPLLPQGETTVLFGDGGGGKSLFGLTVALGVATGTILPGRLRHTHTAPVLYLDYESCQEEHAERLDSLIRGFGVSHSGGIHYRPMTRALADDAEFLRTQIARLKIGLVIVDSYGPACGLEPETAEAAIRTLNALRSFAPVTRLVIAHVSKAAADQRTGPSRPFGSVYVSNLARSVWECRRADADGDQARLTIGLYHRKNNRGSLHTPLGYRFEFDDELIRIRSTDITDQPDLLARTSQPFQVQHLLKSGPRTAERIAEDLDITENTVRKILNRLHRAKRVVIVDFEGEGRKRKQIWGLAAPATVLG